MKHNEKAKVNMFGGNIPGLFGAPGAAAGAGGAGAAGGAGGFGGLGGIFSMLPKMFSLFQQFGPMLNMFRSLGPLLGGGQAATSNVQHQQKRHRGRKGPGKKSAARRNRKH